MRPTLERTENNDQQSTRVRFSMAQLATNPVDKNKYTRRLLKAVART